jgi:SAM-dependent methyltransferase
MDTNKDREARAWQTDVWDRMSDVYWREIDQRFAPVVARLIDRSALQTGEHVLDLGTGTGSVARHAASIVGSGGTVTGTDISPQMLTRARRISEQAGLRDITFLEGAAEAVPLDDSSVDAVLSNLVMMYVIDRAIAARQIARVLKPGGRFIAAVWAGPEECDIVLFQQTAGRFAAPPPIAGVGPGALADPSALLQQLAAAGISAHVETETLEFDFPDFASAWDTLAGVTAAQLSADRQQEAKAAVLKAMYPDGAGSRKFRNATHFIVGRKGRKW